MGPWHPPTTTGTGGRDVFRAWCAAEGREVLLTTRRIRSIHLAPDAVEIAYTCWCGHEGQLRDPRPGRPATPEAPATAA